MAVNLNDIVNKLGEMTSNKKKDDFTSFDSLGVEQQFANIFDKQFSSQFDYTNNMFTASEQSTSDFMSSAATTFTSNEDISATQLNYMESNQQVERTIVEETTAEKIPEYNKDNNVQQNNFKETSSAQEVQNTSDVDEQPVNENQQKDSQVEQKEQPKQQEVNAENKEVVQQAQTELKAKVEVNAQANATTELSSQKEAKAQESVKPEDKTEVKAEVPVETKAEVKADIKVQVPADVKTEVKTDVKAETPVETKVEVKTESKAQVPTDAKIEVKVDVKEEAQAQLKAEVKAEMPQEAKAELKTENIQNQASMERITANIKEDAEVEAKPESKDLDSDKKLAAQAEKVDVKSDNSPKKDDSANQQMFQNQQQSQQQTQIKTNVVNTNNIHFDTLLGKANNQTGDVLFGKQIGTTTPRQALDRNIADQVMKNIRGNISAKNSNVTMILKPAALGRITINVMNQRGVLSTEIKAETQQAADSLNKNINELKQTLEKQGVICENLVVKVDSSNKAENNSQFSLDQNNLKDFQKENTQNSNTGSKSKQASEDVEEQVKQETTAQEEAGELNAQDRSLVDYRV